MTLLLILTAIVGVVTACGTAGSGDLVSEERQVGTFDAVSVSDGVNCPRYG